MPKILTIQIDLDKVAALYNKDEHAENVMEWAFISARSAMNQSPKGITQDSAAHFVNGNTDVLANWSIKEEEELKNLRFEEGGTRLNADFTQG